MNKQHKTLQKHLQFNISTASNAAFHFQFEFVSFIICPALNATQNIMTH